MKIFIAASSLKFIHRYYLFLHKENENEIHVQTQVAVPNFLISFLTFLSFQLRLLQLPSWTEIRKTGERILEKTNFRP